MTRVVGVLGTEATVRQAYVDDLARRFAADCLVLRHGSAELVELAEAKLHGQATPPERYRAVLAGLFGQPGGERIDTIVNACTHFPLVEAELTAAARREGWSPIRFVDGAAGIARRVAHLTREQGWPAAPTGGVAVFSRLGDAERALAPALAAYGFSTIEAL